MTRCHNLKTLKLNNAIPLDKLASLLHKAPQLVELGTGKFSADYHSDLFAKLEAAFGGCKSLRRLSGAWDAVPDYLPAFYCVCEGLTSLNLSYATVRGPELIKFISRCRNLQQLWVCNSCQFFFTTMYSSHSNLLTFEKLLHISLQYKHLIPYKWILQIFSFLLWPPVKKFLMFSYLSWSLVKVRLHVFFFHNVVLSIILV